MQYAAVYPGLAAGDYVVWRDASTRAMIVTVAGRQVTTACWPGISQGARSSLVAVAAICDDQPNICS
jgi:hypothetical protein